MTPFDKLRIFRSKFESLENQLKSIEIDKGIPISHTKTLISPEHEIPFDFDQKYLNEAEKMQEVYKWIYCFENDLRDRIRSTLSQITDWWKTRIPESIRKDVEENKKKEQGSIIIMRPAPDDLVYATLPQLKEIIQENWDLFETEFQHKAWIRRVIDEVNTARVVVGHNARLNDLDIERLRNTLKHYDTG